jgi:hypothetical protein
MIVKAHRGLGVVGDFLGGLLHGMQTGSGGADAGEYPKDTQNRHNPKPQTEFVPKVLRQKQKKHGGEDGGEAELTYPHEQREELQISTSPTSSFGYYYSDIRRKKQDFFVEFFKGRRFHVRLFALCSQKICLSSSQLPESIVK